MARPKLGGTVFYLGRVRHQSRHSARLKAWLEEFCSLGGEEKMERLEALVEGQSWEPAPIVEGENTEVTDLLNDLLGV